MGIPDEEQYISGLDLLGLKDGNTLKIYTMVRVGNGKVMSLIGVLVEGGEEWGKAIQLPDNSLNKEITNLGGADASENLLANMADCFQCFIVNPATIFLPDASFTLIYPKGAAFFFTVVNIQ